MRHKIRQLISVKKINIEKGLALIRKIKPKIISKACINYKNCILAANTCIEKGFLPLRLKGYQFATSLKNPYISVAPSVELKKLRNINTNLLRQKLLQANAGGNKINGQQDQLPEYPTDNEVPNPLDIKRAMNTFNIIYFQQKELKNIENANAFCRKLINSSFEALRRKAYYMTLNSINDPVFEYLGGIRDLQFGNTK